MVWRCVTCRGENVQHACWVRLNTDKALGIFGEWCGRGASWCEDCEDHTQLELTDKESEKSSCAATTDVV